MNENTQATDAKFEITFPFPGKQKLRKGITYIINASVELASREQNQDRRKCQTVTESNTEPGHKGSCPRTAIGIVGQ